MLLSLLRNRLCKHHYHLLTSEKKNTNKGVGYSLQEFFCIYCPKCKGERSVSEAEYKKIMARQEIDKEYKDDRFKINSD